MIKMGPLVQKSLNRKFPDNWKSLAIMMNIPFTSYPEEDDEDNDTKIGMQSIDIEFSDTNVLTIYPDNSVETNAPLTNEMVAEILINMAELEDQNIV